jgi:drug/metabolite transporter (DMT)-like permease
MLWLLLIVFVGILFAIVNILDKHVISHDIRNPYFNVVYTSFIAFLLYTIITIFSGSFVLDIFNVFSFLGGACFGIAAFFYYYSIKKEEVSRVMPLLSLNILFVLIFSVIFLKEVLSLSNYIAVFFLFIGNFLISIKKIEKERIKKLISKSTISLVILATLFFALRTIFVRYSTSNINFLQTLFWFGLGQFFAAFLIYVFSKHKVNFRNKKFLEGIKYLTVLVCIDVIGMFLFIYVVSIAPAVSYVPAIGNSLQDFLVFLFATLATIFKPKFVKEKISKKALIIKFIAIVFIGLGIILISV